MSIQFDPPPEEHNKIRHLLSPPQSYYDQSTDSNHPTSPGWVGVREIFNTLLARGQNNLNEFDFYDFGSGYGSILLAASEYGAINSIGYELGVETSRKANEHIHQNWLHVSNTHDKNMPVSIATDILDISNIQDTDGRRNIVVYAFWPVAIPDNVKEHILELAMANTNVKFIIIGDHLNERDRYPISILHTRFIKIADMTVAGQISTTKVSGAQHRASGGPPPPLVSGGSTRRITPTSIQPRPAPTEAPTKRITLTPTPIQPRSAPTAAPTQLSLAVDALAKYHQARPVVQEAYNFSIYFRY